MHQNLITVFDPSICSDNIGDFIIKESVTNILATIFNDSFFIYLPTHEKVSRISYKLINKSKFSFVGGTNLLSSNMNFYNQWKINFFNSLFIKKNIILMGVGWWQYQKKPNYYTKKLLVNILSTKYLHSVRDSYAENQLKSIGITNTINTGCPSIWNLSESKCNEIKKEKSDSVIFTLTDYNKLKVLDESMITTICDNYDKIYFWPQGIGDFEYLYSLKIQIDRVKIISPRLEVFDKLLTELDIDYIGTRLHAGIRAIQHNKRTMIVGVDNRAIEMAKDYNLPMIERRNIEDLDEVINSSFSTKIKVNYNNIDIWLNQFKEN